MMAKLQRFGGAMFGPVLFFMFSGIIIALAAVFNNTEIVGSIASDGTLWNGFWKIAEEGAWTVFNNMEVLFAIGLPIGLAKFAHARAAMESFVLYMTFNSFVSEILKLYGDVFGVDYSAEIGGTSGLTSISGVKTLDTGVLGAIVIAGIVIYLHNRYFNTKLPDFLGIFQGSALVGIIGFFVMIPVAVFVCWLWPILQDGLLSLQDFIVKSGDLGVFIYIFLEKALLPTGLHHFIYAPFQYGPVVVEGGTTLYWMEHLKEFASSTVPLKTLFPQGGFALQGLSNLFGIPGIALAFYFTARKENRKKVLALLIPGLLTAVFAGVTEPFDYTFLFIAPVLFLVHALLAACLATVSYMCGVVGDMGGGLIEIAAKNWIPMWTRHHNIYLIQIGIGIAFIIIYFVVFRFLILKFNFETPGRESGEVEFYTKDDYKSKAKGDQYSDQAEQILIAFGGKDNIETVSNCATRLRVSVYDISKVGSDDAFRKGGAKGIVRNGKAFQIIVGLSVPQVREKFEGMLK